MHQRINSSIVLNESTARLLIICVLKMNMYKLKYMHLATDRQCDLHLITDLLRSFPNCTADHSNYLESLLMKVFMNEDDQMMEVLTILLQLNLLCKEMDENASSRESLEEFVSLFDLHLCFVFMVSTLQYDDSVMIDWCISSESRFQLFFIGYLRFVEDDFETFVIKLSEMSDVSVQHENAAVNSRNSLVDLDDLDENGDGSEVIEFGCSKTGALVDYSSSESEDESHDTHIPGYQTCIN